MSKFLWIPALLICSTYPAPSFAADFSFAGENFLVRRAGRSVDVFPETLHSRLTPVDDAARPAPLKADCAGIEQFLEQEKTALETCAADAANPFCKTLVGRLRLYAENRLADDGFLDPSVNQRWQIGDAETSGVDQAALAAAVASQYNVAPGKVELHLPSPRHDASRLNSKVLHLNLAPDSFLTRVAPVIQFSEANLGELLRGYLVGTRNHVLACDLAAHRASFDTTGALQVEHVETAPPYVIDDAEDVYRALGPALAQSRELSPLVKAAVMGFTMANALPASSDRDDPLLAPAELFTRLFDVSTGDLQLRAFADKAELQLKAYPDQTTEINVQQTWRFE